eukprot:c9048_g1_i1.p2 GENE.c9048_g1_i1~~c9048_g1_i1.p2  ORF type:complete len:225 (+),score=44.26 c9048_g1_i1:39-677(+)
MFSHLARSFASPARFSRVASPRFTAVRCISAEVFNSFRESEARVNAEFLGNIPEPTQQQIEATERLIEAMKVAADRPSKTRLVGVMDAAIAADNLDYAFLAIQEINKRGFQHDPVTLTRLVEASCAAGEPDRAFQLVDSFINFGVLAESKALALLIEGFVKINKPLRAFTVFQSWDRVDDASPIAADLVKSLSASLSAAGYAKEAATVSAKL